MIRGMLCLPRVLTLHTLPCVISVSGFDSDVSISGRNMNAVIREFSMNERSGLSVTSLTGRVFADSTLIRVPYFRLLTPHSEMNLTAQTYWELVNIPTTGRLTARFQCSYW